MTVRAIRGATTLDVDSKEEMAERVGELLDELMEQNGLVEDDLISILFTATEDLTSTFPATAARLSGLSEVPLICARELAVEGAVARCVRLMIHVETEQARSEIKHVYLRAATGLRKDLRR